MIRIRDLNVYFKTWQGDLLAVRNFNLDLERGEIASIVGESGSGKSVCMLALMNLLPKNAHITAKEFSFDDIDLLKLSQNDRQKYLGTKMSMIFQEPTTSLNPCFRVGDQVAEVLKYHKKLSSSKAKMEVLDVFKKIGIPDAERRYSSYPHQLSGGMNQRIMIAIALALNPKLLIADEPTTALDVTIQAQILNLLLDIRKNFDVSIILITHNMGVVSMMADKAVVLYRGETLEICSKVELIRTPQHPYTKDLLDSLPENYSGKDRLNTIKGSIPSLDKVYPGCIYADRCKHTVDACKASPILLKNKHPHHVYRCIM